MASDVFLLRKDNTMLWHYKTSKAPLTCHQKLEHVFDVLAFPMEVQEYLVTMGTVTATS